ncbi:hypothetical protein EP7_002553 [Isosphaeraceae bacterium EP7]
MEVLVLAGLSALTLLVVMLVDNALAGPPRPSGLVDGIRSLTARQVAIAVVLQAAFLVLILAPGPGPVFALGLMAFAALVWFWVAEFSTLMAMADADFPGFRDKSTWAILMLLLAPLGVPLFCLHRRSLGLPAPAPTGGAGWSWRSVEDWMSRATVGTKIRLAAALLIVATLAVSHHPEPWLWLGIALAVGSLVRAWCRELLGLMARRDAEFPGRHDKTTWILAFVLAPPMAVWAFRTFSEARWPAVAKDPAHAAAFDGL